MSYLNLMRNKLKPKDVNDALIVAQSAIDEINTNVNAISFDTVATITATENETLAEIIDRLRDNYFDNLTQFRQIVMNIDGTSNMIFTCNRWTGTNVSLWVAQKPTSDTSMTTILIGMSSTTVSVRKFVTSASGVTGTNISDTVATGSVSIQGLKFN